MSFFYGAHAAGAPVPQVAFSNNVGPAIQAGVVKQIFLNTTASIDGGLIKARTALNPLVIGAGIGYRF